MTIKVGLREYEIKKVDEIVEVGGECYGTHSSKDSCIKLASKFDQLQQNETFLHELMHAVCEMQSLRELNADEQAIDLLAKGLHMVIDDNPHIFKMKNI